MLVALTLTLSFFDLVFVFEVFKVLSSLEMSTLGFFLFKTFLGFLNMIGDPDSSKKSLWKLGNSMSLETNQY